MRILMIVPQPFFEPRGVSIAVYQHIKALLALGYEVDLLTYFTGKDLDLPGLRIIRAGRPPFVRDLKRGFSLQRCLLDLGLYLKARELLSKQRYSCLFTHDEAALIGAWLSSSFGCKHLYYAHRELSQLTSNSLLAGRLRAMQRLMLRRADEIIAFYPVLVAKIRGAVPGKPVHMIFPPVSDEDRPLYDDKKVYELRRKWGLENAVVLLYTGALDDYQNIALLLQSATLLRSSFPMARYLIVGGDSKQRVRYERLARSLGVEKVVRFVEERPLEEMELYMQMASILLSPCHEESSTPLKIYDYLRSGKPVLATDTLPHTQVLTSEIALLVPPTPGGIAQGALKLLQDADFASKLGASGNRFAQKHYGWSIFIEKCRRVYGEFVSLSR